MNIYKILNDLGIKYTEVEHKAVFTSEEAQFIKNKIEGIGAKNLFLKDKNGYYLVLVPDNKKVNLKNLTQKLGLKHLSFASPEELKNILGLTMGSVTPLGIIHDQDNLVTVILDDELENNKILMHPLINTKTISIIYPDLVKFLDHFNHKHITIKLDNQE